MQTSPCKLMYPYLGDFVHDLLWFEAHITDVTLNKMGWTVLFQYAAQCSICVVAMSHSRAKQQPQPVAASGSAAVLPGHITSQQVRQWLPWNCHISRQIGHHHGILFLMWQVQFESVTHEAVVVFVTSQNLWAVEFVNFAFLDSWLICMPCKNDVE